MDVIFHYIRDFPPVTRIYVFLSLLLTTGCTLDFLTPFDLYFEWTIAPHQPHRLVTCFCFFGTHFTVEFAFHLFFLIRYCRALEEGSFRRRTADFAWMLIIGMTLMLIAAPILEVHFLGSSMTFMMVYVWARRNPYNRMSFLGLFNFNAPYLPWVMLGFSVLFGQEFATDLLGISIGHLYYFIEDVYPFMIPSHRRILKTPALFKRMLEYPSEPMEMMDDDAVNEEHASGVHQDDAHNENRDENDMQE